MLSVFTDRNGAGHLDFPALVRKLCEDDSRFFSISNTRRFSYFSQYLVHRDIKCVVIEEDYVDRDYVRDYANYYSLCFSQYPKSCKRCHLFTARYSKDEIQKIILAGNRGGGDKLQENYEGFFVFRPLPKVAFGRTCFKSHSSEMLEGERKLPAYAKIEVGFFGLTLSIEGMPFQEQDSNVAVCATSALWSAFQVTRFRFGHSACSPSVITGLATSDIVSPNRGLSVEEMIHAICAVGLGAYHEFDSSNNGSGINYSLVKAISFAYLGVGLPIILMGALDRKCVADGTREFMGFHALTVCGYQFARHRSLSKDETKRTMVSDSIETLFCADDQVGPYCQIKVLEEKGEGPYQWCTQWGADSAEPTDGVTFRVTNILVPLYLKIRVAYEVVENLANTFFSSVIQMLKKDPRNPIRIAQWDIQLKECNKLKEEIRNSEWLSDEMLAKVLFKSLPKYMWCVSAYMSEFPLLTFVIDATDISQGGHVIIAIRYDDVLQNVVEELKVSEEFMMHPFTQAYCGDCLEYAY